MLKISPHGKFDNSAKPYDHIAVVPLAAAMGAEIRNVDLSRLTDTQFGEIEDALYRHKMIYFRDQAIGHGDQEAFTLRFGEMGTDAYTKGLAAHPDVQPVVKEAGTEVKLIFGGAWHTDSPFLARPPAISMLHGVDIPPYGGDTIWANSELAYGFLSDTMKAMLAPLRVHMSAIGVIGVLDDMNQKAPDTAAPKFGDVEMDMDRRQMIAGSDHPLIRTHPVTGRKSLYVDQTYTQGIVGMTDAESRPLLDFLRVHILDAAFTCRLRWEPNTVALWDNRSCLHHAFNDHDGYRREMYRTTVLGETPV